MIKYIYGPVSANKTEKVISEVLSHHSNFMYISANKQDDVLKLVAEKVEDIIISNAQFIDDRRLLLLKDWAKEKFINIYFIGLVTDGKGKEYPSHQTLLYLSDSSVEIEKSCSCGNKATHNICVNNDGEAMLYTDCTDTKALYTAVCRSCFDALVANAKQKQSLILAQEVLEECYN